MRNTGPNVRVTDVSGVTQPAASSGCLQRWPGRRGAPARARSEAAAFPDPLARNTALSGLRMELGRREILDGEKLCPIFTHFQQKCVSSHL